MGVPSGIALSPYQLERWAALGRLLTPFLAPEAARADTVPEAVKATAELPALAGVPVSLETPSPVMEQATLPSGKAPAPVVAAAPVTETPFVALAADLVAVPEESTEAVPILTDRLLSVEMPADPGAEIDLEAWFPGVTAAAKTTVAKVVALPAHALEPIDHLPQAAGEFFTGLNWENASGLERSTAAPTARAESSLEAVCASDFFAQSVVWGEGTNGAGHKPPTSDPLGSRMMAAATASALHLSRKLAGQNPAHPSLEGNARTFFSGLDWQLPNASEPLSSSQLTHR